MNIFKYTLPLLLLMFTGCDVGDLALIRKDELKKCGQPVVDGYYPFKLRANVFLLDNGLKIKVSNTDPEISVAVGAYAANPKLTMVDFKGNNIEWCAHDVVNVVGSNYIVTDEGYVGNTILTSELDDQVFRSKIPDGSYNMRFRVVGTATNWCQIKVTDGKISSLKCPEDNK